MRLGVNLRAINLRITWVILLLDWTFVPYIGRPLGGMVYIFDLGLFGSYYAVAGACASNSGTGCCALNCMFGTNCILEGISENE